MKRLLIPTLALSLTGCASFTTTQTDESTNPTNGEIRKITTRASASTFFSSKSALTSFKATQTDKSQSANVGSLSQESTEPVEAIGVISKALDKIPAAK